jgi:hypothetical protein
MSSGTFLFTDDDVERFCGSWFEVTGIGFWCPAVPAGQEAATHADAVFLMSECDNLFLNVLLSHSE